MDVVHAEAEDRLVGRSRHLEITSYPGRSAADVPNSGVVVRKADAVLATAAHSLDRGEEEVVVREAEVRRERAALEALDRDVEALDEDVELVLLGGRSRLVDLDPGRAELDERLEVRADDVARDVEGELTARLDLVLPRETASEAPRLRQVMLVVRPDGERVRAVIGSSGRASRPT